MDRIAVRGCRVRLKGRGVVVTGASQGLGKAIAEGCVREGADVLICAREAGLLDQARTELAALAAPGQKVAAKRADVSCPDEVRELLQAARAALPRLDGLVNNAGVSGPKGLLEEVDLQAWWKTMEVNLFGTVMACREVLPHFRRQGYGKIVNLSGGGATAPMPRNSAYAASKAAVVRFTETLAKETLGAGIDVNALAPGALNTRFLDDLLSGGPERVGADVYARAVRQKADGGVPLEKGAGLCVFLLSAASDGITGRLISAVWDPWQTLPARRGELERTDIYTIRRIVPEDRGLEWN
jgi:NAD(P)-dependent dehydrogenase (short-subunit alcohol dehydrogenase family)